MEQQHYLCWDKFQGCSHIESVNYIAPSILATLGTRKSLLGVLNIENWWPHFRDLD